MIKLSKKTKKIWKQENREIKLEKKIKIVSQHN